MKLIDLDAEIERTLDAAGGDYSDETLAAINEHLRELYALKRESLRDESSFDIADFKQPLNIADWRDLRDGDLVQVESKGSDGNNLRTLLSTPVRVNRLDNGNIAFRSTLNKAFVVFRCNDRDWRFISRPN